jgi:biopolymer transport protein TolR
MGMSLGNREGAHQAEINVTPMIDVLLVLLVIFMIVQQGLNSGLSLQVPPVEAMDGQPPEQLVLSIQRGPTFHLNSTPISAPQLTSELQRILASRTRKALFVDAAEDLSYGEVIRAVDASRAAGAEVIGLVPRRE